MEIEAIQTRPGFWEPDFYVHARKRRWVIARWSWNAALWVWIAAILLLTNFR
jgi:hypothetical protein